VNQQTIEIITNQMSWTANTISELYKSRWQIEIFFREIKQLLHIKTFIGITENAVMIQIWTALITILVLKALKAMAKFNWHLSNLVAFIRLNIFVKITLQDWLDKPFEDSPPTEPLPSIQGMLF
jgi:IS4 transposase